MLAGTLLTIRRSRLLTIAAVVTIWLSVSTDALAATARPVIAGAAHQDMGFSNGTHVVWTQNAPGTRNYDAYVRLVAGGATTRFNERGAGYPGNFVPGTDKVIYQQVFRRRSDLYLYDVSSGASTKLNAISTRKWEWIPRISAGYFLFMRSSRYRDRLLLVDRTTGDVTALEDVDRRNATMRPNFVGDEYATWTVCRRRSCVAWFHRFSTGVSKKLGTEGRPQYGLTVDEATDTAYWARSGFGCGNTVRVWRAPLADLSARTKVHALPAGVDTDWTTSLAPNPVSGGLDLWVQYYDCERGRGDIWVIEDVDA